MPDFWDLVVPKRRPRRPLRGRYSGLSGDALRWRLLEEIRRDADTREQRMRSTVDPNTLGIGDSEEE